MARPVRKSEIAGKLKTLKEQLDDYKADLKTVHPEFKISKKGNRESNIIGTIAKLEREIESLKKEKKD